MSTEIIPLQYEMGVEDIPTGLIHIQCDHYNDSQYKNTPPSKIDITCVPHFEYHKSTDDGYNDPYIHPYLKNKEHLCILIKMPGEQEIARGYGSSPIKAKKSAIYKKNTCCLITNIKDYHRTSSNIKMEIMDRNSITNELITYYDDEVNIDEIITLDDNNNEEELIKVVKRVELVED